MLSNYINAAMKEAEYEILPEGEGYFGTIKGLEGVWAHTDILEECEYTLREVLEEWILLGLKMGHLLLVIDGIELNIREIA